MAATSPLATAARWALTGDAASKLLLALTALVLTLWLAPADFGVVAAATLVITFSQVLWEAGLPKALVQAPDPVDDAAHATFWITLLLAGALYLLLWIAAPLVAGHFGDGRIVSAIRLQALVLPLGALGATSQALLQRRMDFRRTARARLWGAVLPLAPAVPLALAGAGYLALVIGTLVGAAVQTLLMWHAARYTPGWPQIAVARRLLRQGGWISLETILSWAVLWLDTLIIGSIVGTAMLGLYRTGWQIVALGFAVVAAPLLPVFYSHFCERHRDGRALGTSIVNANLVLLWISLPLGVLLFTEGATFERLLVGPTWLGIGQVIAWLGLTQGVAWAVGAGGEGFRSKGRADVSVGLLALTIAVYTPILLWAARHGLEAYLQARLVCAILLTPAHLAVTVRVLHASLREWAPPAARIAAAAFAMGAVVLLAGGDVAAPWDFAREALVVLAAGAFYVLATLGTIRRVAASVLRPGAP